MSNLFHRTRRAPLRRSGLTLVELVMVLAILISLASMSIPLFNNLNNQANRDTTLATLRGLQDIIMNRYVIDMAGKFPATTTDLGDIAIARGLPGPGLVATTPTRVRYPQLHFLYVNPSTQGTAPDLTHRPGWNGPYLLADRGTYAGHDPLTATARGFTDNYGIPRTLAPDIDGDRAPMDGWGNPIVIMILVGVVDAPGGLPETRAYLVSAGADQQIDLTVGAGGLLVRDDDEILPLITF